MTMSIRRLEEMDPFFLDDIGSMIQNKAIETIISPMTLRLCHLIISMERRDLESEVFTSLEKVAGELAQASEEFVQVAKRLAGESEEWLQEEMEPAAESLILSGKKMTLVAQKLHLRPECQSHQEELVTTAQQVLVATTKVLLLEDTVMVRKTMRTVGWCLTCLDSLEQAGDPASLHRLFADLAATLLRLGGLTARGPGERLGRARRLLRGCIPALLAVVRGHLRSPRDPQLAASRSRVFAQTRKILGEVLVQLEPGASAPAAGARNGALTRSLRQLGDLLATPGPVGLLGGPLDALLAAVVWHCMRLAAWSAPPERLRLVAGCHQVLELRNAGVRPLDQVTGPLWSLDSGEERAALKAATEALSQGVSSGLLRQILDTFTDTQSPLQRLVQVALVTPSVSSSCNGEALSKNLQPLLVAFHEQAKQMLRVAHMVLVCCPQQQTGKDLELTMASLWGLVVRVQQLFSQSPQGISVDWSPVTLQALLQTWIRVSESLLVCFDDVLNIPEFLSVSIQEMTKHLEFFTQSLRSGDGREFSTHVAYLLGRAAHIVQVMNRYVGQHRDPIYRNGLRVLIQQLEQSSLVLGAVADHCSGGHNSQDTVAFLTVAKQLVCSAQSIQKGLDGTNHPDILSPLRELVQRFDIAKGQPYIILSSLQDSTTHELKQQRGTGLGEHDPGTSYPPRDYLFCPLISDTHPQRIDSSVPYRSKYIFALESYCQQAVTTACPDLQEKDATIDTAQESLAAKGHLEAERMTKLQEIPMPAPSIIDAGPEIVHCTTAQNDRILEVALQLPRTSRETRQSLAAIAGDWYPLCQQLFWPSPDNDLPGNMKVFMELQQNLASVVQLATKSGSTDLSKDDPDSTGDPEALLQMQSLLKEAEIHAKQLLDKIWAFYGLQIPKLWDESIEDRCLLWSVAVQDLLQCMRRLSRRQSLFLLPLRQAVKDQQGMQEGLAQAMDVSQRLQEAARLTSLLCGDKQVKGEISFLCREVHVLTEALLDVAQILASSPTPSPSLSTRFELLSLELTLRAKALTGYISSINIDYECALQNALRPKLSVCKDPQTRQENSLDRMVSGIQAVQGIVARGQVSGATQEDLLVALESILILTQEVAQRLPVLQQHPEEWRTHILDWLQWEWAAKAHYAVAQLQTWKGGHTEAWRLLIHCLKPSDEMVAESLEQSPSQSQLHHGACALGAGEAISMDSWGVTPAGTPECSVGTYSADPVITKTKAADLNKPQNCIPPSSLDSAAWLHAKQDQPGPEDDSEDSGNRIAQITQEMAKEVFLMAQSLRRRGHILTKDQLIASARRIAASGQNFSKLIRIIAKNCIDQRCSQELLCVVEQIQTMSNQLRIISSVKASLARSTSSEELLVENAQLLLGAVSKTVRAAEAASLRGLRQPSLDPEELEVAAFCRQWRRKLLRHRLQETSNLNCDELGLRKKSNKELPTLAALAQEAL